MTSKSSKTSKGANLHAILCASEAYAALRGLETAGPDATDDQMLASARKRAEGLTVAGVAETEREADNAHAAWLATLASGEDKRADLAVAMLIQSAEGMTNVAIGQEHGIDNSRVGTWLAFARWVVALQTAKGDPAARSGDAATRSQALRAAWNATAMAKQEGCLAALAEVIASGGDIVKASDAAISAKRAAKQVAEVIAAEEAETEETEETPEETETEEETPEEPVTTLGQDAARAASAGYAAWSQVLASLRADADRTMTEVDVDAIATAYNALAEILPEIESLLAEVAEVAETA